MLNKSGREIDPRQLVISKALSLTARKAESEHDLPGLKKTNLHHEGARGSLPVLEIVKRQDSLCNSSKSTSPTLSIGFSDVFDPINGTSDGSVSAADNDKLLNKLLNKSPNKPPKYHRLLGEMGKARSASEFCEASQRQAMSNAALSDMQKMPSVETVESGSVAFQKITELDSLFGTLGMVGPGGSTTGNARHHKYAIVGESNPRPTRDQLTSSQDAADVQSWFRFENGVSKT
uniref:Uncharacterized protein n=1 Tax=Plectus sambesii TaxID=2011161 RepID=A0A914V564_9BILA